MLRVLKIRVHNLQHLWETHIWKIPPSILGALVKCGLVVGEKAISMNLYDWRNNLATKLIDGNLRCLLISLNLLVKSIGCGKKAEGKFRKGLVSNCTNQIAKACNHFQVIFQVLDRFAKENRSKLKNSLEACV